MSRCRIVFGLVFCAAMMVAISAFAQPEGGRRGARGGARGGGMGASMLLAIPKVQEDLKLTAEQKEQIKTLAQSMREQRGNREEMAATEKKIQDVLNADQQARLKQIQLQVQGVQALMNPEVAKELGLTEDQTAKLRSLRQEQMEKMRDIPQEERATKMAEMRKEMQTKSMAILTPEQKEKLEKMQGAKIEIEMPAFRGGRNRQPAATP